MNENVKARIDEVKKSVSEIITTFHLVSGVLTKEHRFKLLSAVLGLCEVAVLALEQGDTLAANELADQARRLAQWNLE